MYNLLNAYLGSYLVVADWDLVEKVWEHAEQSRLKVKLSDHPVLVSEKPFNTSQCRLKYTVRECNNSTAACMRKRFNHDACRF